MAALTVPCAATASAVSASEVAVSGTVVYSTEVDGNEDVFLVELGGEPVRLTSDAAKEFDPDLSPDGERIVYRRNPRANSDDADIWIVDRDGEDRRNLTNAPELANWSPAWTPDGRIVFASGRAGSTALELWIMDDDGGRLERVAEGWCEYPSPSPNGDHFVCSASVGGAYDLVIVSSDGTRTPLTTTPMTEFGASWSPDGEWISFSRDTDDRWELHRIRPDGSDDEVVAAEGVFSTWTPDGLLAWSGPGGINVASADGSGRTSIGIVGDFVSWGS